MERRIAAVSLVLQPMDSPRLYGGMTVQSQVYVQDKKLNGAAVKRKAAPVPDLCLEASNDCRWHP